MKCNNTKCCPPADKKDYLPRNINDAFCCGCYEKDPCPDIQEGEFEFTVADVPVCVYGICNAHRNHAIFRKSGDCDKWWTSVGKNEPALIKHAGDYVVRYRWDACCQGEPQFETAEEICCK